MVKRTGPTNSNLRVLISELKTLSIKNKNRVWKMVAENLEKSTRSRREVSISRINKNTKNNDIVIIPGKVLSTGDLDHKVTVAAFRYSQSALQKINKSGKAISIQELTELHPNGKNIKIIG